MMSITVLTILQFLKTVLTYLLITVLLPAIVFHAKVKSERISIHFLIYYTIGNFYMMNLVFVLQLLHVCNRFTIIFFTIIPAILTYGKIHKISFLNMFQNILQNGNKMILGQLRISKIWLRARLTLHPKIKACFRKLFRIICNHTFDIILMSALTAAIVWKLGANLIGNFGYGASDLPVHNYWINGLSQGKIYVAGIYPEGFHAVLYYLHIVFNIDTYVLLRIFWMVQYMMAIYVLFAFLKACCKGKYLPYVGVILYLFGNFFNATTYLRFYSTLPQEFGQVFILPPIYFISAFFETRKTELENDTMEKWSSSNLNLILFILSFSLTIAIHFYDTMICGMLCVGIAIGYGFRFFQRRYYSYVLVAGAISVVVAVLPMVIAFITGTKLQGSLIWGLKIILGEDYDGTINLVMIIIILIGVAVATVFLLLLWKLRNHPSKGRISTLFEFVSILGIIGFVYLKREGIESEMVTYVLLKDYQPYAEWILYFLIATVGVGILVFVFRERDYGARIISTAIGIMLLGIMLASSKIGIPTLMQPSRVCIYFSYLLPCAVVFLLDGALFFIFGVKLSFIIRFLSLALVVTVTNQYWTNRSEQKQLVMNGLETTGAIICLSNIIRQEKDMSWTICSCNDEYRMAEDHGWHYETITFLEKMEGFSKKTKLEIPTQIVYFFIEKQPIDYAGTYGKEIPAVSEEGAKEDLPQNSGLNAYTKLNRWITMSKMYYWAKSFQKLYPNEMKVYYEDDEFICYRIEQNVFRLYNFAIDYNYNRKYKRNVTE